MNAVMKEELYRLIDQLPESEYPTAWRVLEGLRLIGGAEPLYTKETAPFDDEPESAEEQAAVAEAYDALARGDVVRHDDLRRELGL